MSLRPNALWRRLSVAGLVVSALVLWTRPAVAYASGLGGSAVFLPPYTESIAVSGIHLTRSCVIGNPPVTARNPDATTGSLDHATSASVKDCEAYDHGRDDVWMLGRLPPRIAGTAGTVVLLLRVDRQRTVIQPGPMTGYASGALSIDHTSWPTVSIRCVDGRCSTSTLKTLPGAPYAILETTLSSLPQVLTMTIESAFSITGTGGIGIEFRGALVGVGVTAGTDRLAAHRATALLQRLGRGIHLSGQRII